MVNKVAKGRRIANKLQTLLREAGFEVAKTEYRLKYHKIDLFSLFDFLIIKPHYVAFIQVTTNQPHNHQPFLQFTSTYKFEVYQFVWYDRKGWVVYNYVNGKYYKLDMRKKMLRFKISYKDFVELSEDKIFRKLYENKKLTTTSYRFVEGDVEFEVVASDEVLMEILQLPKRLREVLLSHQEKE